MRPGVNPATLLVVDDDGALGHVFERVLAREGHTVFLAGDATEALQTAGRHPPQFALVDLCLPDGDGVELSKELRSRQPDLPLALMTAYPLRLGERPELTSLFMRVLAKPISLEDLRQTVDSALLGGAMTPPTPSPPADSEVSNPALASTSAPPAPPTAPAVTAGGNGAARSRVARFSFAVGGVLLGGGLLGLVIAFLTGARLPLLSASPKEPNQQAQPPLPPALGVSLVKGRPHTLEVPEDVRAALGIRKGKQDIVAFAQLPTMMRPLTLTGSTALDPIRLGRIRARFAPARVVEIGRVHELSAKTGRSELRELRNGDRVKKGDVLGVFYSVDVGSKKNDLLNALVQLELDQKILDNAEEHREAVPPVFMETYKRAVQGDRNEINRALNNLKLWDIPQDEIDAVRAEAKKLSVDKNAWFKTPEGRWAKGEKQGKNGQADVDNEQENPWGRVTLRAPFDGVIVECNVAVGEMVVDNTVNLFQIADVGRLLIIANAPEDDLPILEALLQAGESRWTVRTVGTVSATGLSGNFHEISYLIDPNDHSAKVKGYVDNPGQRIRGGQTVSATIRIPPPKGVVEIPSDALVEDGKQSLVFVQADAAKSQYTMRRVHVTHRFDQRVFVRSTPIPKEEQLTAKEAEEGLLPKEPLRSGERVLQSGAGELKAALLNLESQPGH